jgi:hypothetical protein
MDIPGGKVKQVVENSSTGMAIFAMMGKNASIDFECFGSRLGKFIG